MITTTNSSDQNNMMTTRTSGESNQIALTSPPFNEMGAKAIKSLGEYANNSELIDQLQHINDSLVDNVTGPLSVYKLTNELYKEIKELVTSSVFLKKYLNTVSKEIDESSNFEKNPNVATGGRPSSHPITPTITFPAPSGG